jgi:predicted enzyme related to lactoylglutathione lyase
VGGGMQKKPMAEAPTMWLPYVEVDDVKETIAKARKAGATIFVEYESIGEMGAIGVFGDPTGAALGVWETAKKPKKAKKAKKK